MADIHVQPRKRARNAYLIWIVVAAVLIAAAIAYYLTSRRDRSPDSTTAPAATGYVSVYPLPLLRA
jgi:cytochrome c-type biogenesis protein CcmH/NrfF